LIHTYPKLSSETNCSSEWSIHGTCCEEKSLIEYAKKDSGDVQLYVDQLHKEVLLAHESINILVKGLMRLRSKIFTGTLELKSFQIANGETLPKIFAFISKSLSKLNVFLTYLSTNSKDLIDVQSQCAQKMNKMRSSALCSLCSGRGPSFLLNEKAIVEQEDCNSFVNSCFQSWVVMINIVGGVKHGQEVAQNCSDYGLKLFSSFDGDSISNIRRWLIKSELVQNVNKCGRNGSEGCSAWTKAKICQTTLNLAKPTYLKDTLEFFAKSTNENIDSNIQIVKNEISKKEEIFTKKNMDPDDIKYTLEKLNLRLKLLENQKELKDDVHEKKNPEIKGPQNLSNSHSIQTVDHSNWEIEEKSHSQVSHSRRLQTFGLRYMDPSLLSSFESKNQESPAASTKLFISDTNVVPHNLIPAGSSAVRFEMQFP
jgi:hypothetical protein